MLKSAFKSALTTVCQNEAYVLHAGFTLHLQFCQSGGLLQTNGSHLTTTRWGRSTCWHMLMRRRMSGTSRMAACTLITPLLGRTGERSSGGLPRNLAEGVKSSSDWPNDHSEIESSSLNANVPLSSNHTTTTLSQESDILPAFHQTRMYTIAIVYHPLACILGICNPDLTSCIF